MKVTKHRSEVAKVKKRFDDKERDEFFSRHKNHLGARPSYDNSVVDRQVAEVDKIKREIGELKGTFEERQQKMRLADDLHRAQSKLRELEVLHGPGQGRAKEALKDWNEAVDRGLLVHGTKRKALEYRAINDEELSITKAYLAKHPIAKTTGNTLVWLDNGECYRLFTTKILNEYVPERESPLRRCPQGDLEDLTVTVLENAEGAFRINHDGTLETLTEQGWVRPQMTTLDRAGLAPHFDLQLEEQDAHEFVELRGGMLTPPVLAAREERLRELHEAAEQARIARETEERKARANELREQVKAIEAEIGDL